MGMNREQRTIEALVLIIAVLLALVPGAVIWFLTILTI